MKFVLALATLAILTQPLEAQSPARGLRDQQIEQEIHTRLAKSVIGKDNFKVRVREGVAYWEGSTLVAQRTWIVDPEDVSVLDPTPTRSLTLVTCYPFYFVGSAPQRFIVRAVRVNDSVFSDFR